jgi:hypothetical protein
MASPSCPSCGEPTHCLESRANDSVAYCQACGWNVAGADLFLQNFGRQLRLVALFFLVVLAALLAASPNRRNSLEDGAFLVLLMTIPAGFVQRRLSRDTHRLAEVRSNLVGAVPQDTGVPEPDPVTLAQFNRLRLLPCPRSVRLNPTARAALNVTKIMPIGLALWGIHDVILPDRPIALAARTVVQAQAFGLGILGLGVLLWFLLPRTFGRKTELRILENGQIALARVTGPSTRSRLLPSLTYEFTDPTGIVTRGELVVFGGTMIKGDSIIVFYDPQRPSCCVALCSTSYEFAAS